MDVRACLPSRRRFLKSVGVLAGSLALGGCGLVSRRIVIRDADEALEYVLSALRDRYDEEFELVAQEESPHRRGVTSYNYLLAPQEREGEFFSATARVLDEGSVLEKPPTSDRSQYLFKGRAEAPFLEALAGCAGIAGYAATLQNARYDDKVWRESDFDRYMGDGGADDPYIMVALMMPKNDGIEAWAKNAAACFERLYDLKRPMYVYLGVEGHDAFVEDCLRAPNVDEIYPATRRDPPTADYLAERFRRERPENFETYWDGKGRPDGLPQNPNLHGYYPTITWNPGCGPDAW